MPNLFNLDDFKNMLPKGIRYYPMQQGTTIDINDTKVNCAYSEISNIFIATTKAEQPTYLLIISLDSTGVMTKSRIFHLDTGEYFGSSETSYSIYQNPNLWIWWPVIS